MRLALTSILLLASSAAFAQPQQLQGAVPAGPGPLAGGLLGSLLKAALKPAAPRVSRATPPAGGSITNNVAVGGSEPGRAAFPLGALIAGLATPRGVAGPGASIGRRLRQAVPAAPGLRFDAPVAPPIPQAPEAPQALPVQPLLSSSLGAPAPAPARSAALEAILDSQPTAPAPLRRVRLGEIVRGNNLTAAAAPASGSPALGPFGGGRRLAQADLAERVGAAPAPAPAAADPSPTLVEVGGRRRLAQVDLAELLGAGAAPGPAPAAGPALADEALAPLLAALPAALRPLVGGGKKRALLQVGGQPLLERASPPAATPAAPPATAPLRVVNPGPALRAIGVRPGDLVTPITRTPTPTETLAMPPTTETPAVTPTTETPAVTLTPTTETPAVTPAP